MRTWKLIASFVGFGALGYFAAFHVRILDRAAAQTRDVGFTFRMATYAEPGSPQQRFQSEAAVTFTTDGGIETAYSLPNRPLSEAAITVRTADGENIIALGSLGLRTRGPKYDALAMARRQEYLRRLVASNCVDESKGERFIRTEKLLGAWDAVVVTASERAIGSYSSSTTFWRLKQFDCYAVQYENRTEKDGVARTVASKLVAAEPATAHTRELLARFTADRDVKPSELYQQYLAHVGQSRCEGCDRDLERLDQAFRHRGLLTAPDGTSTPGDAAERRVSNHPGSAPKP